VLLELPPDDFETREVAQRCHRCLGAWVDGDRVGVAFPALRQHGQRIRELSEVGAREEGVRCPRCREAMLEFPFFDLWLDICETCHGMWLDGDERRFVEQAAQHEDGLPERAAGGYRGRRREREERVTCIGCSADVHPRRTLLTGDGPVCDHCVEVERMSAVLGETSPGEKVARAPGRLLGWLSRLLDASGRFDQRNRGMPK
jgi:Zn-finger nucleic acid-binding protein